ncbi:iron complex transport system substrate-binding protein [Austwickia chelonae]|uniref:Putative iron-siderophore ABC transporter substrate-binding protein n=1 Tax=Austwickia chelonae NBRC 105200 TaxID=1184607 RepID=K6VVE4_9MICO|nr:iron-siderophore ABC transporter substrate-binding protein [Austwickia chelonae]GAB79315.1 putative iron-siderophore ABC transporter substrate-binding protein [Austwickia chelonae NBRC 105200]SEW38226.1 iron complex transport system substrate-binding protein [Austwickia chelonae]
MRPSNVIPGGHPRSRRALAALSALTAAVVLSGCGAVQAHRSPSDAGGERRTITHAMGESTVTGRPQRVAALDQSYVEAVALLRTPVVAITTYHSVTGGALPHMGEGGRQYVGGASVLGTLQEPSLEKLTTAKPDLILSAKVRHEKLYDQLSAIAPTVMSQSTGPTWKENILLAGKTLGKEDLAKERIAEYEKQARKVGDAVKEKAGRNPKISVVRFMEGKTRLYQAKSFSGIVLKDAGLDRPESQAAEDFATEISEEKIPMADGDKIFVTVADPEKGKSTELKAAFEANPLWADLASRTTPVDDLSWMSSVSVQGAYKILEDLAKAYEVPGPDPLAP